MVLIKCIIFALNILPELPLRCQLYDISLCAKCYVTSVLSSSSRPLGLQLSRLLCLWHSPGKNTGVDCYALLRGIFQGIEPPSLVSCREVLSLAGRYFTASTTWEAISLCREILWRICLQILCIIFIRNLISFTCFILLCKFLAYSHP